MLFKFLLQLSTQFQSSKKKRGKKKGREGKRKRRKEREGEEEKLKLSTKIVNSYFSSNLFMERITILKSIYIKPDMVGHIFNLSIQGAEAGRSL